MTLVLSHEEQEQVDALKAWWRANGRWVIATVVVALLFSVGWHGWQWWRGEQMATAARHQQALVAAIDAQRWSEAQAAWEALAATPWAGSRQAPYAALTFASAAARAGNWAAAEAVLHKALPLAEGEAAVLVRRLAAMVRLAQNDPQGAVALLERAVPAPFGPLFAEARGDVQMALGAYATAERLYEEALAAATDPSWRAVLEAKRDQARSKK